jgi:hypothetical protein
MTIRRKSLLDCMARCAPSRYCSPLLCSTLTVLAGAEEARTDSRRPFVAAGTLRSLAPHAHIDRHPRRIKNNLNVRRGICGRAELQRFHVLHELRCLAKGEKNRVSFSLIQMRSDSPDGTVRNMQANDRSFDPACATNSSSLGRWPLPSLDLSASRLLQTQSHRLRHRLALR